MKVRYEYRPKERWLDKKVVKNLVHYCLKYGIMILYSKATMLKVQKKQILGTTEVIHYHEYITKNNVVAHAEEILRAAWKCLIANVK
ncbi:MAG: hypothetical protein ACRC6X_07770 [Culicoidibacterales bacterium]